MDTRSAGLLILGSGVVLVLIGLVVFAGGFGWFGRLPGDIRIVPGGMRIYFPLASMIVISVALSVLLALLRRVF